jgi:hypothetical protein
VVSKKTVYGLKAVSDQLSAKNRKLVALYIIGKERDRTDETVVTKSGEGREAIQVEKGSGIRELRTWD